MDGQISIEVGWFFFTSDFSLFFFVLELNTEEPKSEFASLWNLVNALRCQLLRYDALT